MISTNKFISILEKKKINFFCGVPDSVLNSFVNGISKKKKINITAPNEGSAVSAGIGYYLKTKKLPLIYFQNSGIGNAADPLTSLAAKDSYSIPMILLVGWRGSPNMKDEPQHKMMGRITLKMMKLFDIKTVVLKSDQDLKKMSKLISFSLKEKKPVALIIESKKFSKINSLNNTSAKNNSVFRPDAIECILNNIKKKTKIISTVGYTSRELYQIKNNKNITNGKTFLMIGGMGHTAMVSLGVEMYEKNDVVCLDGDGSFLMHLGGVATAANYSKGKLKYVLFDNNCHESVGKHPTISGKLNFKKISEGFGFEKFFTIKNKNDLKKLPKYINLKGTIFILIKTKIGSLNYLERPSSLNEIKNKFMR